MRQERVLQDLVYEFYVPRILFGFYNFGDQLPSVTQTCEQFQLGRQTVRATYQRMEQEGYISVSRGKRPVVAIRLTEKEQKQYIMRFFAPRRDALLDWINYAQPLFQEMILSGCQRLSKQELDALEDLLEEKDFSAARLIRFILNLFAPLGNPLINNLITETALFLRFPFLYKENAERKNDADGDLIGILRTILSYCESKDRQGLEFGYSNLLTKRISDMILSLDQEVSATVKQIPFTWPIYRDRPQLCYTLTNELLCEIVRKEPPPGQFLPSVSKIAEEYGVSVKTVRRAIKVLDHMGITRTINGRGTMVILRNPSEAVKMDLTIPEVQKNLVFLLQSMQIFYYTLDYAVSLVWEKLSEETIAVMLNSLYRMRREHEEYKAFGTCILVFIEDMPSPTIRQIYSKLYKMLYWGFTLRIYRDDGPEEIRRFTPLLESLISALKKRDSKQLTHSLQQMLRQEIALEKQTLLELGIEEVRELVVP